MNVELPEKRYYSIGEVAKAFDVNASLIRFWEKEFKTLSPKKSANGKRKYTSDDIIIIKQIFFLLKEKGFTIEGAKTYIKEAKKKPMNSFEIIEKLNEINLKWLILAYNNSKNKTSFFLESFNKLAGTYDLKKQIIEGKNEKQIKKSWKSDLKKFNNIRVKYLLYD